MDEPGRSKVFFVGDALGSKLCLPAWPNCYSRHLVELLRSPTLLVCLRVSCQTVETPLSSMWLGFWNFREGLRLFSCRTTRQNDLGAGGYLGNFGKGPGVGN